jgi:hypothetical protein
MFRPHSMLWNYLWVGPNVFLIFLGIILWCKGRQRLFPVFIAFSILSSIGQFALYTVDVSTSFSAETFWLVDWISVGVDAILKFIVIAEIFAYVFGPYPSIAQLGKYLIQGVGIAITLAAALAAAYTPRDGLFGIVSGLHILEQTVYLIECGLLAFIFVFASYFHLTWDRFSFGIALGLSLSASVHLATKAVVANAGLSEPGRNFIDFVNMGTYHVCVMIWCYYLLFSGKSSPQVRLNNRPPKRPEGPKQIIPGVSPHDQAEVLSNWNRELERLIHQ